MRNCVRYIFRVLLLLRDSQDDELVLFALTSRALKDAWHALLQGLANTKAPPNHAPEGWYNELPSLFTSVEDAVLDFVHALLREPYPPQHPLRHPLLCAFGLSTFGSSGVWLRPRSATTHFSALVYVTRTIVLLLGHRDQQGKYAQLLAGPDPLERPYGAASKTDEPSFYAGPLSQFVGRHLPLSSRPSDPTTGGLPIHWVWKARAYGQKLALSQAADCPVTWNADRTRLVVGTQTLEVEAFRTGVQALLHDLQAGLDALLFSSASCPPVPLEGIPDAPGASVRGGSLLSVVARHRGLDQERVPLYDHIRAHEVEKAKWFTESPPGLRPKAWRRYVQADAEFQKKLLVLVHLTAGMPARSDELLHVRWLASGPSHDRSLFVDLDGRICFRTDRNKGHYNEVWRTLPRGVSELLFRYLFYVRPFVAALQSQDLNVRDPAPNPYLFTPVPVIEREILRRRIQRAGYQDDALAEGYIFQPFPTATLGDSLQRVSAELLGSYLSVSGYRQLVAALAREFLSQTPTFLQFGLDSAAALEDRQALVDPYADVLGDDPELTLALDADDNGGAFPPPRRGRVPNPLLDEATARGFNHSRGVHERQYGVDSRAPFVRAQATRERLALVSQAWHEFLGASFPVPPARAARVASTGPAPFAGGSAPAVPKVETPPRRKRPRSPVAAPPAETTQAGPVLGGDEEGPTKRAPPPRAVSPPPLGIRQRLSVPAAATGDMSPLHVLFRRFAGADASFRGLQYSFLCELLGTREYVGGSVTPPGAGNVYVLYVAPPGQGKTTMILFLASLSTDTFVFVAPLRSLADDLEERATQFGIRVHRWSADRPPPVPGLATTPKLLVVTPEAFMGGGFQAVLASFRVSGSLGAVILDEAHTYLESYQDEEHGFRPKLLRFADRLTATPSVLYEPVALLTATLPPADERRLLHRLGLRSIDGARILREPVVLPQHHHIVAHPRACETASLAARAAEAFEAWRQLVVPVQARERYLFVVYTHADVTALCAELDEKGWGAFPYHAGLPESAKRKNMSHWKLLGGPLVCTPALSCGVDTHSVRVVFHVGLPFSCTLYYQCAARAGRDGTRAWSILIPPRIDSRTNLGSDRQLMADYIRTRRCRRQWLQDHLDGASRDRLRSSWCGARVGEQSCDNCYFAHTATVCRVSVPVPPFRRGRRLVLILNDSVAPGCIGTWTRRRPRAARRKGLPR